MINLTAVEANTTEQWILPAYIAYTSFVLFSLVLAVGVVGNVLVLIVILTSKSMRSSTNLFLLNLSIADLLVLIVCCPNAMIEMYMRRVRTRPHQAKVQESHKDTVICGQAQKESIISRIIILLTRRL